MSGLVKSSSLKPEARSMARAPARLAPEIKVLLRRFGNCSLTSASPHNGPALLIEPGIQTKKFWAPPRSLGCGPESLGTALLRHHQPIWHPLLPSVTTTGLICTILG